MKNERKTFKDVLEYVKSKPKQKVAIACAADEAVLKAAELAYREGMLDSVLFDSAEKIKKTALTAKIDIDKFKIVDIAGDREAAAMAVKSVKSNETQILMKGHLSTSMFLKAVLDKECGLRKSKLLSHIQIFECPITKRIKMLSDGGMNLYPKSEELYYITANAISAYVDVCNRTPNVALISAFNYSTPHLATTSSMSSLAFEMKATDRHGNNVNINGPMTLDVAISKKAADKKRIGHNGAGDSDIFIVPNIETGNLLGKSLMYFSNSPSAGLITGAAKQVIMLSRADDHQTKLNSMAIGCLLALAENEN